MYDTPNHLLTTNFPNPYSPYHPFNSRYTLIKVIILIKVIQRFMMIHVPQSYPSSHVVDMNENDYCYYFHPHPH